jgi:hypothetical protein
VGQHQHCEYTISQCKRELKEANEELAATGKAIRCSERRQDAWLADPVDVARHASQGAGCFELWLPTCMALGRQTGLSLPCFPCYLLAWTACYLRARWGPREPEESASEEVASEPQE